MTTREKREILGFFSGLIISFLVWTILGFFDTTVFPRLFWTMLSFGGGSVGLIVLIYVLEYQYHVYKDKQKSPVLESGHSKNGLVMYSAKGFVVFLLVACSLTIITVMAFAARVGALTEEYFLLYIRIGSEIGASITFIVYLIWHDYRNSRFHKKKQEPPKKISITRGQTVLEAEHHRLTEVRLEEIKNLHELTRINLGLNSLREIDLAPLAGSTNLKELVLYMNHLETIDLTPLASCPNLEYLDLTCNDLEMIDLAPLSSCIKLAGLNIGGNRTSYLDLSPISECKDMEVLNIDNMNLREIDLSPLRGFTKLWFLKLDDNDLVSLDITPLFECESLTEFPLDNIELTTTLSQAIEDWPIGVRKYAKRFRKS
ncbi:MAG: leucine-rich repeat domain-containing protein [Candidatus Sifarchaeia archaeon]